jgi:hypothetical protein
VFGSRRVGLGLGLDLRHDFADEVILPFSMPAPTSKRSNALTLALFFCSSLSMVKSPSFTNTCWLSANSSTALRARPSMIFALISGGFLALAGSLFTCSVAISRSLATMSAGASAGVR